jgi:hypothetical protein
VRSAKIIVLGMAVSALSLGLVLAQDAVLPAPTPAPGETPPTGAPPIAAAPTVTLPPGAVPPPEEAELPENAIAEARAPPEPVAPPEDAPKADPQKRPRFSAAVLQAVDKVTAETLRFEAKVNEPVRFKGVVLTVHACEGTAPDEGFTDAIAHVDIQSQPEALTRAPARVVFRGWMFASSPALHPVEHPLYDVWLIACRTPAPVKPGGSL